MKFRAPSGNVADVTVTIVGLRCAVDVSWDRDPSQKGIRAFGNYWLTLHPEHTTLPSVVTPDDESAAAIARAFLGRGNN
jgi:hypothetical protein